jgi:tetratricopeptide (TPR) repeat protein
MLMSAVIGLIDEESGAMYYINAEHPWIACYRGEEAFFIENELTMHKIGTIGFDIGIVIRTLQLQGGDVLFFGSDGRDDVLMGMDEETGQRIINEDETRFLRCIEEVRGDLTDLVDNIIRGGELTDDFTLIRIEWKKPSIAPPPDFEAVVQSADKALADKDMPQAIQLLRKAAQLYPEPEVVEKLAACLRGRKENQEIIQTYRDALNALPLHETLLLNTLRESRRIVRELQASRANAKSKENVKMIADYIRLALDCGRRLLNVNPMHFKAMLHTADCFRMDGRFDEAKALLARAREIVPEDENLKLVERMLEHDEAQHAQ